MPKLFVAVVSVLITTIACGMIYILFLRPSSPLGNLVSSHAEKLWNEDIKTINSLNRVHDYLVAYYQEKNMFPESLREVEDAYGIEYFPSIDTNRFQLCANFQISSDDRPNISCMDDVYYCPGELVWYHPIGRYCFTKNVELKR